MATMTHKEAAEYHLEQAELHKVGSDATTEHIGKAIAHSVLAVIERINPSRVTPPEEQ